jgi:hypothetical protein
MSQQLIDQVLVQILKDVTNKDLTAIEELLRAVPEDKLKGFLPE